jgi:hypothetical protein
MTNTTESFAPVYLPSAPDYRASSAAFKEHAEIVGRLICAARPRTPIVQRDMPTLVVAGRSWPRNADKALGCAAALERGDVDRFLELMGVPESVQLSQDGRAIDRYSWCGCDAVTFDEWVYVEVWGPLGRLSHGWVHEACRRWTQTG